MFYQSLFLICPRTMFSIFSVSYIQSRRTGNKKTDLGNQELPLKRDNNLVYLMITIYLNCFYEYFHILTSVF